MLIREAKTMRDAFKSEKQAEKAMKCIYLEGCHSKYLERSMISKSVHKRIFNNYQK